MADVKETIAKLVDLQKADHKATELRKKRDDLDGGLSGARKLLDAAKAEQDAAHKEIGRAHV